MAVILGVPRARGQRSVVAQCDVMEEAVRHRDETRALSRLGAFFVSGAHETSNHGSVRAQAQDSIQAAARNRDEAAHLPPAMCTMCDAVRPRNHRPVAVKGDAVVITARDRDEARARRWLVSFALATAPHYHGSVVAKRDVMAHSADNHDEATTRRPAIALPVFVGAEENQGPVAVKGGAMTRAARNRDEAGGNRRAVELAFVVGAPSDHRPVVVKGGAVVIAARDRDEASGRRRAVALAPLDVSPGNHRSVVAQCDAVVISARNRDETGTRRGVVRIASDDGRRPSERLRLAVGKLRFSSERSDGRRRQSHRQARGAERESPWPSRNLPSSRIGVVDGEARNFDPVNRRGNVR
eukprot:CAMPEP_0118913302 /NCGR_PEP_ID=MMETSP1166-20130328/14172_1 /TAXON_ID=1104430 /ORGANISM="Chrysoreinhardia sp, Strain CCMP3193" /LENGTH=353 /DNA_ID=CAMNT_0006852857 /DNA_START=241 /DNA_END=1302 /DNA_ORIENTATION=-